MKLLLMIYISFLPELVLGQMEGFDRKKWVQNKAVAECVSYRGCVSVKSIFEKVNNQSQRFVRRSLGKPDYISIDSNGIVYFIYEIETRSSESKSARTGSTISILIRDKKVFDIIKVNESG